MTDKKYMLRIIKNIILIAFIAGYCSQAFCQTKADSSVDPTKVSAQKKESATIDSVQTPSSATVDSTQTVKAETSTDTVKAAKPEKTKSNPMDSLLPGKPDICKTYKRRGFYNRREIEKRCFNRKGNS